MLLVYSKYQANPVQVMTVLSRSFQKHELFFRYDYNFNEILFKESSIFLTFGRKSSDAASKMVEQLKLFALSQNTPKSNYSAKNTQIKGSNSQDINQLLIECYDKGNCLKSILFEN